MQYIFWECSFPFFGICVHIVWLLVYCSHIVYIYVVFVYIFSMWITFLWYIPGISVYIFEISVYISIVPDYLHLPHFHLQLIANESF